MGFYPVTPAGGVYALGSPMLEEVQIDVRAGETFTMHARGLSPTNMFIQSGTFNGKPLKGPWITHDEIMKGGTLELTMGAAPHRAWGSDPSAVPPAVPPK
jgi:putative alpha-1,2-mannosidase